MALDDYLNYAHGKTVKHRKAVRDEAPPAREEPATPSEPIEVHEHDPASTTIIRRMRRYWNDKRS